MIPGDIDLTENLDFRKVVKKEAPQLPEIWNKNNQNKVSASIDNISYTTNSNYYYTYRSDTYYSRPINFSYYAYNNDRYQQSIYDQLSIEDIDIQFNTWFDHDTISYNITSSTSSSLPNIIFKIENEYDIFGNVKEYYNEDIPKIPWSKNHIYSYENNIAWNNKSFKYNFDLYYPEDNIPWCIKENKKYDLTTIFSRAKNLISWLSDKGNRFIDDYLRSDEDDHNLSYLTNMSWIGIKDAIIE